MKFTHKWLPICYSSLIIMQGLDVLTTWIGLGLGLSEGNHAMLPYWNAYGIWGLAAVKFLTVIILGSVNALVYLGTRRYSPDRLQIVAKILTVGSLWAALLTLRVVVSNLTEINYFMQHYRDVTMI